MASQASIAKERALVAMSVTDKPRMERDFLFGERGKTQGHSRQHGHPDHMGHSEQPNEVPHA